MKLVFNRELMAQHFEFFRAKTTSIEFETIKIQIKTKLAIIKVFMFMGHGFNKIIQTKQIEFSC